MAGVGQYGSDSPVYICVMFTYKHVTNIFLYWNTLMLH